MFVRTNCNRSLTDKFMLLLKVEGLEVGLTLSLETVEGSLKVSLLECGCYVNGITIKLNGGASWLYQGYVSPFCSTVFFLFFWFSGLSTYLFDCQLVFKLSAKCSLLSSDKF